MALASESYSHSHFEVFELDFHAQHSAILIKSHVNQNEFYDDHFDMFMFILIY